MQKLYEQVQDTLNEMERDLNPKSPIKKQINHTLSILKRLLELDGVGEPQQPQRMELSIEEFQARYKNMYQEGYERLLLLLSQKGITGADVAKAWGKSTTQVSHMKTGFRSVPESDFFWLLEKFGYESLIDHDKMSIEIIDKNEHKV